MTRVGGSGTDRDPEDCTRVHPLPSETETAGVGRKPSRRDVSGTMGFPLVVVSGWGYRFRPSRTSGTERNWWSRTDEGTSGDPRDCEMGDGVSTRTRTVSAACPVSTLILVGSSTSTPINSRRSSSKPTNRGFPSSFGGLSFLRVRTRRRGRRKSSPNPEPLPETLGKNEGPRAPLSGPPRVAHEPGTTDPRKRSRRIDGTRTNR